jgi:hypothetical protein
MTATSPDNSNTATIADKAPPAPSAVFGSNELRLNARQWLIVIAIFAGWMLIMPRAWKHWEAFPTGADYRIPYSLSKDYWLYERRIDDLSKSAMIPIFGDSVVWGEYVRPDGTLSHFLNQQAGRPRFINAGVNGLFPLAMEGLVDHYAGAVRGRKVIVHCNLLWLTSPKADLSTAQEERFNHSRLVPQFSPRIPAYHADANERLSAELDQHVNYFAWSAHLQNAYYDQRSIPQWTLMDDGNEPPNYPNAWRNPLAPLKSGIPTEPANDPLRGPTSPRHKAWNAGGAEPTRFEWVDLDSSLQWHAFQRVVQSLHARGNDVMVIVGTFNEHMIAQDQRATYRAMQAEIVGWLAANQCKAIAPQVLPSELYADASHPLTEGYSLLAKGVSAEPQFSAWSR